MPILTSVPVVGVLARPQTNYWVVSMWLHPQEEYALLAVFGLLEAVKGQLLYTLVGVVDSAVVVDNATLTSQNVYEK